MLIRSLILTALISCSGPTRCYTVFDDCADGRSVTECCNNHECAFVFSDGETLECAASNGDRCGCDVYSWSTVTDQCYPSTCIDYFDCCEICSPAKACGDECLHASYECDAEPGCACDAVEVCRSPDLE